MFCFVLPDLVWFGFHLPNHWSDEHEGRKLAPFKSPDTKQREQGLRT